MILVKIDLRSTNNLRFCDDLVNSRSAIRAEEDENGVRHMLMCRVILGNTETISPGSKQLQPSSTDFDSGIDNPVEPTKYIIWSAYMNTHIFPSYIVSFTAPSISGNHSVFHSNSSLFYIQLDVDANLFIFSF